MKKKRNKKQKIQQNTKKHNMNQKKGWASKGGWRRRKGNNAIRSYLFPAPYTNVFSLPKKKLLLQRVNMLPKATLHIYIYIYSNKGNLIYYSPQQQQQRAVKHAQYPQQHKASSSASP